MITDVEKPIGRRQRVRLQVLKTAADLFYRNGVRAVGMEQIVETSGIAKTTIYRHFPTKDALVEAFLDKEDHEFWSQWDAVTERSTTPANALDALCKWIGERVTRSGYRGCPQLNIAAEFADPHHPARLVAARHKAEMFRRLKAICSQLGIANPAVVAVQIALLFDGAFMSDGRLDDFTPTELIQNAIRRLTSA